MKLHTDNIHAAVKVIASTVSGQGDIGSHFLVTPKSEGWVDFQSTNGQSFTSVPVPIVSGDPDRPFTVDAKRFQKVLGTLPDGIVDFGLEADGDVKITSTRGDMFLPSLNPDDFPKWSDQLGSAKTTATVSAKSLNAALSYSRQFIYDRDDSPDFSVLEAKEGCIYSTDKVVLCVIRVPGLENSSLKIHRKTVPHVVSFLATCGDDSLEVLETDRMMFFRRKDGAVLGVTKYQVSFPQIRVSWTDRTSDPADTWESWGLLQKDVLDQLRFLVSGASETDLTVRMNLTSDRKNLQLRMRALSGRKDLSVTTSLQSLDTKPGATLDTPESGIPFSYPHLVKCLAHCPDTVALDVVSKAGGDKGFLRVLTTGDGNDYLTVITRIRQG